MTLQTDSQTTVTVVSGMTCQHCVRAVTEELRRLAGVRSVAVDLDTGRVTITGDRALPDAEIAAAVDEAGYSVAG